MYNKVILIGRLGKDPEVRRLSNDKSVANFPLVTSKRGKDSNGDAKEYPTWHNVVAWNKSADIVEKYVKKGDLIQVEGEINNRSYENSEGEKKYVSEVVINSLVMLGSKNDQNAQRSQEKQPEGQNSIVEEDAKSDDVPF